MGQKASSGNVTALLGKQTAPSDLGYPAGVVLVPKGEYFATDALAKVESGWLDKINAIDNIRWRVLPLQWDVEPTKEDAVYVTSTTGNVAFVRAGKTTVIYKVKITPFVMAQLNNLNGIEWDLYIITSNGFITGWSSDRIKFQPFSLQNFRVEGEVSEDLLKVVPIVWTYDDATQWNSNNSFIQPLKEGTPTTWNPRDVRDPKAITSLVTLPATTGFTIYLEGYDKVPFTGAVKEDIIIRDISDDSLTALTSLTEDSNTPGLYVAVATIAAATYDLGMAPVGSAGATQGYAGLDVDLQEEAIS